MATILCPGSQSCLDSPQLVEPRALRLKLSASISRHSTQPLDLCPLKSCYPDTKTNEPAEKCHYGDLNKEQPNQLHDQNQTSNNSDMGGWSFLQCLSNCSQSSKLDKEKVYVHPLVTRSSSSSLSEKSLKLCTENLGNETGTDMSESGILSDTSSVESKSEEFCWEPTAVRKTKSYTSSAASATRRFPPPLTTMSGAESLQVRPHREEGRLIIKAVKTPSRKSCFHAERSHGRLRLCFLENYTPTFDSGERVVDEENESYENDTTDEEEEEEEEEEKEVEDVEEQVGERVGEGYWMEEEMDEKKFEVEGKMGIENFERQQQNMRRCKEGGEHENKKLILNCEAFWVAT